MSKYNSRNCFDLSSLTIEEFEIIEKILQFDRFEDQIKNVNWNTSPQYTLFYPEKGLPTELKVWGDITLENGDDDFKTLIFNL